MTRWQAIVGWVVAIMCAALGAAGVALAMLNQRLERQYQSRQGVLGGSLLSQQGQQLTANVLKDMGQKALTEPALRALLARHGLQLQSTATNAPAAPRGGTEGSAP